IQGKLTLHGVTKEVILKGKYLGSVMAYDVKRIVFKAETEINRKDFGLKWNDFVEAGPAVGDEVTIRLRIEAKRVADL
ncbi:YceI family protein, partial [Bacteriovorax sp. DB6_IX]|uniref:YceI family protein n=1 Tax=Bacteriovorax sp. DB6_IX TaxID=1353530 RepID=UPI00038A545E